MTAHPRAAGMPGPPSRPMRPRPPRTSRSRRTTRCSMAHTPTGCPLATMETESDAAAQRTPAGSRQHPGVSGLERMRGAPNRGRPPCLHKVLREFVEPEDSPSKLRKAAVCASVPVEGAVLIVCAALQLVRLAAVDGAHDCRLRRDATPRTWPSRDALHEQARSAAPHEQESR